MTVPPIDDDRSSLSPSAPVLSAPGAGGRSWRPVRSGTAAFDCGRTHDPATPGSLDERARRLSHEEFAVARALADEGHEVCSVREARDGGRRPDLAACGTGVEVKSFLPVGERGRLPGPQSVYNKLVAAAGQAGSAVVYAKGSGLRPGAARAGMALYAARARGGRLSSVRVIGDGFDLAWARTPSISVGAAPTAADGVGAGGHGACPRPADTPDRLARYRSALRRPGEAGL